MEKHSPSCALSRVALVFGLLASTLLWSGSQRAVTAAPATPAAVADCASQDLTSSKAQVDAYAKAGDYAAVQENAGGHTSSVSVEVPAIDFSGPGQSTTLPVGPCQYIHRYVYSKVQTPAGTAAPFVYVEIDWNTEGKPRGPNGSFSAPHFDFHFYLLLQADVEAQMTCVSTNGKTCDGLKTDYTQMQRFLNLPDVAAVPATYRPDVDSSIPAMGLHLIDSTFDYTVDKVNHSPTLLYGTFSGKVVFAEASVTLDTLQDAMAAPGGKISFPFAQPAAFASGIDWPSTFTIQYLPATGGFKAGFEGFVHHP